MTKHFVDAFDLLHLGGEWLAEARRWIQWNCSNGSYVTWGSQDLVGPFTVQQIETLAAHVAAVVMNEMNKENKNG